MDFKVDVEKLKETSNQILAAADLFNVKLENLLWSLELSDIELLALQQTEKQYMMKELNVNEEDYIKYCTISSYYSRLEEFYDRDAVFIRQELQMGMTKDNIPFDVNLTKEEAYQKYASCDRNTARNIAELVAKADEKVAYLKKDLREHYKGNLITQLGIQIEPETKSPTM